MLGSGLSLWAGWQAGTALGIFLGAQIPEGLSLDFTLVVTFIALSDAVNFAIEQNLGISLRSCLSRCTAA